MNYPMGWLRKENRDVAALLDLAYGTTCEDWPALFDLMVETVGPARPTPGSRIEVWSLRVFDWVHDEMWRHCKMCRHAACTRCWPFADKSRKRHRIAALTMINYRLRTGKYTGHSARQTTAD